MNKETKKLKQWIQNHYIAELHNEVEKRWKLTNHKVSKGKDDYETNQRIIRSHEKKLPKTVKNKIKNKVYK